MSSKAAPDLLEADAIVSEKPAAPAVSFKYVEERGAASADRPPEITALAEHLVSCRFEDIPLEAVTKAKLRVLDLFGCGIGGVPGEGNEALVRCLDLAGSAPRASVIGFATKLSAGDAALEEKILEAALEAGADDVVNEAGESSVLCTPDSFEAVQQALATAGLKPSRAEVVMRPANRVAIPAEAQETLLDLIDWLEELDDVHEIYHNAVLPVVAQ